MASIRVVEHIFGPNFQLPENLDEKFGGPLVTAINTHLQSSNLQVPSQETQETSRSDDGAGFDFRDGRVGNRRVSLDIPEMATRIFSADTFKIIGVNQFGTVKSNCGVCKGKWQYEVLLLSSGVMQIGWSTFQSKFGSGQGVGDTADSYSFDGSRVRKWNVAAENYGEKWEEDDIIGCCIDLNDGCIEFYRNGTSMGTAYKAIAMGAGIVYFPAISLQPKEGVIANFGSSLFHYPVDGYQPIHEPPREDLSSATYLLGCISKLLSLMDSRALPLDTQNDGLGMSHETLFLEIGKALVLRVTPHFKIPYIVETKLVPFIQALCNSENTPVAHAKVRPSAMAFAHKAPPAAHYRKLNIFLDLLWMFSEESDLKEWTSTLITRLSVNFQHNMRPLLLEFSPQKEAIFILHCLLNHKHFRRYLMKNVLFDGVKFPWFMNIIVPSIESFNFWEFEPSIKLNKLAYMAAVNQVSSAMDNLEDLQIDVLVKMMDDTDGSEAEPSSKSIFLRKFRILRRKFYAFHKVDPSKSPGNPHLLARTFFLRLLRFIELLCSKETKESTLDAIPPTKFYNGSISYYDIDRLGGVLIYLIKTYYKDLEKRLGSSQSTQSAVQVLHIGNARPMDSSTSTVRNISGSIDLTNLSARLVDVFEDVAYFEPFTGDDNCGEEMADIHSFLTELLDGVILFYHISAKTLSLNQNICSYETRVDDIAQSLSDTKGAMKALIASNSARSDELKNMEFSYIQLVENLHKATAHLTTLHAVKYTERHLWLYKVILNTMKLSADDEHLFNFVPEFYLDCLVDMLKALSIEAKSKFLIIEDCTVREQLMQETVQFICDHIDDQRVRIAKAKDTLLSTLLEIVMTPNLLDILHHIPAESQMKMIRFLLQPYENRAWANSNWILVRIWHGSIGSFGRGGHSSINHKHKLRPKALSYQINPFSFECDPYPSYILQEQIQHLLMTEPDFAETFLNSILNELNWAFSEFIGMLQELQNVSNRRERVLVESRQLKICATCFDLTLALLRVLEMVSSLALPVFVRPDQPNYLLTRLCQLLCQVLNRASSQDGCFHHITTLEVPGLENIDHLPILTAVCGILLALLKEDIENFHAASSDDNVPMVSKTLLMEPSFQMSCMTFLLEEGPHLYSLRHYREFVSSEDISQVEKMLMMLDHYYGIIADTTPGSGVIDEDDLCTICFAYPISAIFEPCKHHSCRACITHHLMNCKNCFFCKAAILKVVDSEGKVIFNAEQGSSVVDSCTTSN